MSKRAVYILTLIVIAIILAGCDNAPAGEVLPQGQVLPGEDALRDTVDEIAGKTRDWFGFSNPVDFQIQMVNLRQDNVLYDSDQDRLYVDRSIWNDNREQAQWELMRELVQAMIWRSGEPFMELSKKENDFFAMGFAAYIFYPDIFGEPFSPAGLLHQMRYSWNTGQNRPAWSQLVGLNNSSPTSKEELLVPLANAYFLLERYGIKEVTNVLYWMARSGYQPVLKERLEKNLWELEADWKRYYGLH